MKKNSVELSPQFRQQATKAVAAIILFLITYLLILGLAVGLTITSVYLGIALMTNVISIFTIGIGLGLCSFGILILIFLVKFLFKTNTVDRSHLIEITKSEEPALFNMIEEVARDVGTSAPKKVYLSADVNASVFYNSSFWSMFFPIRKNLQVGLGLINVTSNEELKAILAHEFGHFSQKTMKVGSYVYNVNHVIHNMLHDNDGYDHIIQGWAEISGFFAIFASLAIYIIRAIQWILIKVYAVVNKSYMALSREMEFQADEIAAHVTGYIPLKESLLRLDIAQYSFNNLLEYYDGKISDKIISANIYPEHGFIMNFLAKESQIELQNNLPNILPKHLQQFDKSKLEIKDQWASHPSTIDRIARLEQTGLDQTPPAFQSAHTLLQDSLARQRQFTEKIFSAVSFEISPKAQSFSDFSQDYKQEYLAFRFDSRYADYYDNKEPLKLDIERLLTASTTYTLTDLFNTEKTNLVYESIALQKDLITIKQIAKKEIPIKTFDYDGIKYNRKQSNHLTPILTQKIEAIQQLLQEHDEHIFLFFIQLERQHHKIPLLQKMYQEFQSESTIEKERKNAFIEVESRTEFIGQNLELYEIENKFKVLIPKENAWKKQIKGLLEEPLLQESITPEIREGFEKYLAEQLQYIGKTRYYENNLQILFGALHAFSFLMGRLHFLKKKALLDYQISLLEIPSTQ